MANTKSVFFLALALGASLLGVPSLSVDIVERPVRDIALHPVHGFVMHSRAPRQKAVGTQVQRTRHLVCGAPRHLDMDGHEGENIIKHNEDHTGQTVKVCEWK